MAAVWYAVLLLCISIVLMLGTLFAISRQPLAELELSFSAPFSPWMPGVSILINVYLMFQLDAATWLRYAVWIAVGLSVYFGYGVWHSDEREKVKAKRLEQQQQQQPNGRSQQDAVTADDGTASSEPYVIAAMTSSQDALVVKRSALPNGSD